MRKAGPPTRQERPAKGSAGQGQGDRTPHNEVEDPAFSRENEGLSETGKTRTTNEYATGVPTADDSQSAGPPAGDTTRNPAPRPLFAQTLHPLAGVSQGETCSLSPLGRALHFGALCSVLRR